MFNSFKLQTQKSPKQKLMFLLMIARRWLTDSLGAHQLDSPTHYCRGYGLEIGASNGPYPFAKSKMDYADFFSQERSAYLGRDGFISLQPPKCLLDDVESAQYDFVYASHVLEHTPNPLKSIEEWTRVLRPNGVLHFIVPNKEKTYDIGRAVTPLANFVERYDHDAWDFTLDEIRQMVSYTTDYSPYEVNHADLDNFCINIQKHPDGSHHYFVFDPISTIGFSGLLETLFNLKLVSCQLIRHEIHVVMKNEVLAF